jgi:hypothetical protein
MSIDFMSGRMVCGRQDNGKALFKAIHRAGNDNLTGKAVRKIQGLVLDLYIIGVFTVVFARFAGFDCDIAFVALTLVLLALLVLKFFHSAAQNILTFFHDIRRCKSYYNSDNE